MTSVHKKIETQFGEMRMSISSTSVTFETIDGKPFTVNRVPYSYRAWLTFESDLWQHVTMDRIPWETRADVGSEAARNKVQRVLREFFTTWKETTEGRHAAWQAELESLRDRRDKAERDHAEFSEKAEAARSAHHELQVEIIIHKDKEPT